MVLFIMLYRVVPSLAFESMDLCDNSIESF